MAVIERVSAGRGSAGRRAALEDITEGGNYVWGRNMESGAKEAI